MNGKDDDLFTRVGGEHGMKAIVEDMYARLLKDPELASFFANTDMQRLRNMQYQFLAAAFDGPVNYTGAELTQVHAGRGIGLPHYAKFCGHFADTMQDRGIDAALIDQSLGRLAIYKDRVTGDTNVDG
ncbi:MAG: group 1 truncated hemoglobin [Planctomycetota bacterium]